MGKDVQKELTGKEFMKSMLGGERDFLGIKLTQPDLTSDKALYEKFTSYLRERTTEFKQNPVVINNASLSYMVAPNISLPYVKGSGVHLYGAECANGTFTGGTFEGAHFELGNFVGTNFENAYLCRSNLKGAYFSGAILRRASLGEAHLCRTNFGPADFRGADLEKTDFCGSDLWGADFRGVSNLQQALFLDEAFFGDLKVTKIEEQIFKKALLEGRFKVIEEYPQG